MFVLGERTCTGILIDERLYVVIHHIKMSTSMATAENSSSTAATGSATKTATAATNNDTLTIYKDLIEFLQSPRQDLRLEAVKAVMHVVHDRYVFLGGFLC